MTRIFNDEAFERIDRITDELIAAQGDWLFDNADDLFALTGTVYA